MESLFALAIKYLAHIILTKSKLEKHQTLIPLH